MIIMKEKYKLFVKKYSVPVYELIYLTCKPYEREKLIFLIHTQI